jgi:hypothetical protein
MVVKSSLANSDDLVGEPYRIRTCDILISQVLGLNRQSTIMGVGVQNDNSDKYTRKGTSATELHQAIAFKTFL